MGMSHSNIALALNISVDQVYRLEERAIRKLRASGDYKKLQEFLVREKSEDRVDPSIYD
jgi:DNA-binding CsgD family transcriptional regulator